MNKYLELFLIFCKVSMFTLGGGLAMLPVIEREVTEKRRWLDKKEFLDIFGISNSMPGVMILNVATSAGYKIAGARGAVCASLGTILPPFVSILIAAWFLLGIKDNPFVEKAFSGIRPAVMALISLPIITLSRSAKIPRRLFIVPVLVVVAVGILRIQPAFIILLGLLIAVTWLLAKRGMH